jgi:type II secretory pathway component GspD/PulD (secretin)
MLYFSLIRTRFVSLSTLRNASLGSLLAVFGGAGLAFADGNPDIVGVLAILTDNPTAADLGLSEEQLEKLRGMVKQQESKALEIASQLRNLEPAERRLRAKEILRSLENGAMALLNETQKKRAEQLRLQQVGLAAVLEPEIAQGLGATEEQIAKVQTLVEGKRALLRELGPDKGDAEWRRQLGEIFDATQTAKWNEMIGSNASTSAKSPDEGTTPATSGEDANPNPSTSSPDTPTSPSDRANMPMDAEAIAKMIPPGQGGLTLNFNSVPWSDVLKWLSKEADLSLQTDFYPPGTFTYRDPYRTYSVPQAMDIMNSVLLSKGFSLIRYQRALICIDLGSGENAEIMRGLIREMVELVPYTQLDQRGEYELCKTVFTLQRLSVEEAEKEVKQLLGPHGSIVPLTNSNQLLITETGGKLRLIRETIQLSEMPEAGRMSKILVVALKHMSSEELLGIARPLLGLKDATNVSEDLSISTDAFGAKLFATGSPDKLQKLRDIVMQIDVEPEDSKTTSATTEQAVVRSHTVRGSDPQTTMDVLQTQFAGQSNINLALDPKSNNIIARATPTDHGIIEEIIETLAGETSDFQVIQLDNIDTQAAILTLEKFFGKQSSKDAKDASAGKGPIFYGDTLTRRIMVKGTKQEVEQVRELLNKVQSTGPTLDGLRNNARFLPYSGKSADKVLNQIDILWEATKKKGRIRKIEPKDRESNEPKPDAKSSTSIAPASTEQVAGIDPSLSGVRLARMQDPAEQPNEKPAAQAEENQDDQDANELSTGTDEVKIYRGPNGLIVTSDDPQLLNEFDEIARVVQEQMAASPTEPTVFYLQHISAAAAEELIRGVLGGTSASSSGGGGGGLLGEVASSVLGGGGFLGSLLGMGGGGSSATSASSGSSTASGDVFITADPRQNALWVQANGLDMQLIEQLIEIIDTETGPVDIRTRGIPRIIYLETAPVAQVESTVKAVFADRLSSNAQAAQQRPPSPQEFIEALRGGGGGGRNRGSAPKELKEQTMSITADTKNNALIVMAPKQLFDDVEALVKELDKTAEGAEDSVVVVPLGGEVNPTTIRNALSSVFGSQARTSTTSNPQPATSSTNNPQANAGGFRGFNPAAFGGGQGFQGFGGGGNPFGGGGNPFGGAGAGGGRNPFGGGGMQGFQGFRGMGGMGGGMGGGNQGGGNQGGGNQGGGNRVNRNRGN